MLNTMRPECSDTLREQKRGADSNRKKGDYVYLPTVSIVKERAKFIGMRQETSLEQRDINQFGNETIMQNKSPR